MSVRLFVLLARDADVGVVFRRGPSKQVLLLRWNLKNDAFEAGQWLKARIYERRCDLSPSGDRLVYFAASYRGPYQTWTAVSRPPYLTALALWPKGDAWGGGGLFSSENELLLNHPPTQVALAEGFSLPRNFKLGAMSTAGAGEDSPIFDKQSRRDGWELVQEGTWKERSRTERIWWRVDPPEIWAKAHPHKSVRVRLLRQTEGVHEKDGPWYVTSYRLAVDGGGPGRDLGRTDWADWSSRGDLLFARDGKLFRLAMKSRTAFDVNASPRELIDLTPMSFEAHEAPPTARKWSGSAPSGRAVGHGARKGRAR